ncbi:hypothetical protein J7E62_19240 [Variovorax paradoxus]|nr:hypothetical protein [Variovorax paradoxus]
MSPSLVVLTLALLLGIQPVTTDLYLPALPALTDGFGARMSQAQLTLSALLLAFGSSQLVFGPLSDRFGRQPCGQTGAVGPFRQAAGAASALNGFVMMLAAFGIGGWLGARMDGTVLPLALGMWFWSACLSLVAWTLVRKHGH